MGTNSNIKNIILVTAISYSVLSMNYDTNTSIEPSRYFTLNSNTMPNLQYDTIEDYQNITNLYENKIEAIIDFSEKLVDKMEDIDPEFIEIINDNFWDLF